MGGNSYIFLKSGILTRYSFRFLCNFLVYKMAKHGKQLPDDTKNTIVQLIEGSYQASEVANILNISKSTISKLLKRWRERSDTGTFKICFQKRGEGTKSYR
jgi:DNA invertase Pin-like site-specific DNA recombinase